MFGLAMKKTVRLLEEKNSEYVQKISELEKEISALTEKSSVAQANEALAALSVRYEELVGKSA